MSDGFWRIADALAGRTSPKLGLVTNGTLLSPRNVSRLMQCPLGTVAVSIDAATPQTYRNIRGGDMERPLAGVRRLVEALEEKPKQDRPDFYASMVLMRANIEEAPAFVELCAELRVDCWFEPMVASGAGEWKVTRGDFQFEYDEQRIENDPERSDHFMRMAFARADALGVQIVGQNLIFGPDRQTLERSPCRHRQFSKQRYPTEADTPEEIVPEPPGPDTAAVQIKDCYWPETGVYVYVDGRVKPCCYSVLDLGNVCDEQGLAGHWDGEPMRSLRECVADNRFHPLCHGARCSYVQGHVVPGPAEDDGLEATGLQPDLIALARIGERNGLFQAGHAFRWTVGDREKAVAYFERSAALGQELAHFALGEMFLEDVSFDPVRAAGHFEDAIAATFAPAMIQRALMHLDGLAGPVDHAAARALVLQAGDRDDAEAWRWMAIFDAYGFGAAPEPTAARRSARLALQRKDLPAKGLVELLESPGGVPAASSPVIVEAVAAGVRPSRVYAAAATRDPTALFVVGLDLVHRGHRLAAVGWLRQAAALGDRYSVDMLHQLPEAALADAVGAA